MSAREPRRRGNHGGAGKPSKSGVDPLRETTDSQLKKTAEIESEFNFLVYSVTFLFFWFEP